MNNDDLVRLDEICVQYFGLSYPVARRKAAQKELPVPAFRLRDSQKAPLMVRRSDLTEYVNKRTASDGQAQA